MVRAVVLAAIVSACVSCRAKGPVDPIGHGSSTSNVPGTIAGRRSPRTPEAVLAGKHRAPVTIASTLPVPGGTAVVYTYGLLQSYIGERTASGYDVVAELAAERQHCEDERAAMDPGEREWVEAEYQSCEELAGAKLFGNDQLAPQCEALAVAYFDPDGILLAQLDVGGPCVWKIGSFEAYDLTPEPDDELILVATFETFGELPHGGWGRVELASRMHVLAIRSGAKVELVEPLEVELDTSLADGVCSTGIERSARIPALGVVEVFSQPWNDCDDSCVHPAEAAAAAQEAEAAGEVPEDVTVCPSERVTAERARWIPEERSWTPLESFPYEGTVLPDGIM